MAVIAQVRPLVNFALLLFGLLSGSVVGAQSVPVQKYGYGIAKGLESSPDGRYLLTYGSSGAFLWDARTGDALRSYRSVEDADYNIAHAAFSADLRRIIAVGEEGIQVFELSSSRQLYGLTSGTMTRVAAAPDRDEFAIILESRIGIVDFKSGSIVRILDDGTTAPILGITYSSDGGLIAVSKLYDTSSTIQVWSTTTSLLLREFETGLANSVLVFSPDSTRIAKPELYTLLPGGLDLGCPGGQEAATVYDWNLGLPTLSIPMGTNPIESLTYSPDGGRLLVTSQQGCITSATRVGLFDTSTGDIVGSPDLRPTSERAVLAATFLSGGDTLTLDSSGDIDRFPGGGNTGSRFIFHGTEPSALSSASAEDVILSGGRGNGIAIWNRQSGAFIQSVEGGPVTDVDYVSAIANCAATNSYFTAADNLVRHWDDRTHTMIRERLFPSRVASVAAYPDGSRLLVADRDRALVWNLESTAPLVNLSPASQDITEVAVSSNGQMLAYVTGRGDVAVFSATTFQLLSSISITEARNSGLNSCMFSADGSTLAVGGADYVAELNLPSLTVKNAYPFTGRVDTLASVRYVGTEPRLAVFYDTSIVIWNTDTGLQEQAIDTEKEVAAGTVLPKSRWVVAAKTTGEISAWPLSPARAIIIAGGGNYAGNSIARQTDDLGAYAYRALRARGYLPADIQYLSAFGDRDADFDGLNDVDGVPNLATTSDTLRGPFATEAGRLLVLMIDHGYRTDSFVGFRSTPNTILSSQRLRGWLDKLQANHPVDATIVIDSCYSGQMATDLLSTRTVPLPPNRLRTVVASTGTTGVAVFLPPPDLTGFMQTYLGSAYMGSSVAAAYQAGSDLFTNFPVAGQKPMIFNSDGTTTEGQARREFFGASWAYGVQQFNDAESFFPVFDEVAPASSVLSGQTTRLWVRVGNDVEPTTVVATLRPPAPEVLSGDPVTTLPTFILTPKPGSPREWEVTPPVDTFAMQGVYRITYTAKFETGRIAKPGAGSVSVSNGPDPDQTVIRAVLGIGSSNSPDTNNGLQTVAVLAAQAYVTRFQDNTGTENPQWIKLFSEFNTPALLPVSASASALLTQIYPNTDPTCGRLYVHLAGESDSPGSLRLANGQSVAASDLDAALDNLQSRQNCEVVLVVDCPNAGHFALACAKTGTQKRVVIVSGRQGDPALFLQSPPLSFSGKFLGAALQGSTIFDALQSARAFFADFLAGQPGRTSEPLLDDDGDANMTFADGTLARTLYLGRRYAFADDSASGLPFVLAASPPQTHTPGSASSPFTAFLVEGVEPLRVYAVVVPPGFDSSSIATLPAYDLFRDSAIEWTWSAPLPVPTEVGDYTVAFYAEYPDGTTTKISAPAYSLLTSAPVPTVADGYETAPYNDSTNATGNNLLPGDTQVHTLHVTTDEDWMVAALPGFSDGAPVAVPFSLRFSDFSIPSGVTLSVEVTPTSPAGSTQGYTISPGGLESVPMTVTGASVQQIRIRPNGLSTGQGVRYRITLEDTRGGNIAIISQIGSRTSNVGWAAPAGAAAPNSLPRRYAATYTAWRVYRTGSLPASPRTLVGGRDWPAAPGCPNGVPPLLQPNAQIGDAYFEVLDTYEGFTTPEGFAFLTYEVVPVTGTTEAPAIFSTTTILNITKRTGFASPDCAVPYGSGNPEPTSTGARDWMIYE